MNGRLWLSAMLLLAGCQGLIDTPAEPSVSNGSPPGPMVIVDPPKPTCVPGTVDVGTGKWRRLTSEQYRNTVRDLLQIEANTSGFLLDTRTGPFATNTDLAPQATDIDGYASQSERLALAAVQTPAALLAGCNVAVRGEDGCAAQFIARFGERAFRHALTPEQTQALTGLYTVGKEESFTAGLRLVVEGALQSPEFLYLAEFGGAPVAGLNPLDDYELATRLSYFLWNTMPDPELFDKAKLGTLHEPAELRRQAQRLMASDRFVRTVSTFQSQLMKMDTLLEPGVVSKNAIDTPRFVDAMKTAMLSEAESFTRYLLTEGGGTVRSQLTAQVAFPTGPLLQVYGLSAAPPGGKLTVTDGSRTGLLTLPALMAAVPPLPTRHQATIRGHLVRKNLLCQEVPAPNIPIDFSLPPNADQLSNQELLRAHKDNKSCSGCHELMDPIGFGFENFNGLGGFTKTGTDGKTIDASGYVTQSDVTGDFKNSQELAGKLASSIQVRKCLAQQWFRFGLARNPKPDDACSLEPMQENLSAGDGDIRSTLLALVTSDAFRYRKGVTP
jgi:hypothetical protein